MMYQICIALFLSFFSTAVMSYISMATPIGPWIDPTLALLALILFHSTIAKINMPVSVVVAGGIGGILATACGFSFPAIYFLNPALFNQWMAHPWYFITLLSGLAFSAGWFGFLVANVLEQTMLQQENLSFPIGQLVYKTIAAGNQWYQAVQLAIGAGVAMIIGILQGVRSLPGILPRSFALFSARKVGFMTLPGLMLDMSIVPMTIAIGFVTGHVIAFPLFLGALVRFVLLEPINQWYFAYLGSMEFMLAFCSGMILVGACSSLLGLTQQLISGAYMIGSGRYSVLAWAYALTKKAGCNYAQYLVWALFTGGYFYHLGCSLLVQLYMITTTYACVYVMVEIAGKIGIAHLGRYATFVMVPAMVIFSLNEVQLICIATFVEIAGGVAVDLFFGRKVAQLAAISLEQTRRYQYLGLIVSALSVGVVFWFLVSNFQLGSVQLFAYKAQARQLLINARQFDYVVLMLGMIGGYLLQKLRINPGMVLGGLLMPLNISAGLIIGGYAALVSKNREYWYPFWSGIFAGNSLWMLMHAFFSL